MYTWILSIAFLLVAAALAIFFTRRKKPRDYTTLKRGVTPEQPEQEGGKVADPDAKEEQNAERLNKQTIARGR